MQDTCLSWKFPILPCLATRNIFFKKHKTSRHFYFQLFIAPLVIDYKCQNPLAYLLYIRSTIYTYNLIHNNYVIVNEHFLLDNMFPNIILFYIWFEQDIK